MPDTNKNRIAVVKAAEAVVDLWEKDIFSGSELVEKEDLLIAAVKVVRS